MDTSRVYVRMCEKAIEIQDLSPVVVIHQCRIKDVDDDYYGSFFYLPKTKNISILHYDNDECRDMIGGYGDDLAGIIWLPRQDQLQEMILSGNTTFFLNFVFVINNDKKMLQLTWNQNPWGYYKYVLAESVEQLWLGFTMREKFNKVWNGEDWVLDVQK